MPEKLHGDTAHRPPGRRRRYSRSAPASPAPLLTPTKWEMLRYLAELRFLSLPQIARLCCPAGRRDLSEKSARRHLRSLFDAGLVDVLPVSRAALAPPDAGNDASLLHGSAPNVYAPAKEGLRLLVRAGHTAEDQVRRPVPSYGPRNSLFLAHELLVRDVRVWLEEVARKNNYGLECWRDGEAAKIGLGQTGTRGAVRPDAWFVLRLERAVLVGLVEVDRGTERGDRHWREKLALYGALYGEGKVLRSATGYLNARILVVVPEAQRRDRLASLLGELDGAVAARCWLACRVELEQQSLTSLVWRRPGDPILQPLVSAPLR